MKQAKKILALILSVAMVVSLTPAIGFAVEGGDAAGSEPGTSGGTKESGYVLMNIPYADFYKAELGEDAAEVDAVTSATKNKPRTGGLAGGSYHKNADGTDISGVIYPVYVEDMSQLKGLTEVTDASSVDITVTNRGQTTTTTYSGKDALFESADYSYYKLTEKPERYKTLTIGENGKKSFSAVSGEVTTVEGVTYEAAYNTHHHNFVEIELKGTAGINQGDSVSGGIITFSDNSKMALRHVVNIWRTVGIGGDKPEEFAGKTITNVRYYTQTAVIDFPVNIPIKKDGGSITAVFDNVNTLTVTGLPEDIQNPVAKVQTQVGRGETPVVIAENASVANGKITTTTAAKGGTTYNVSVVSDNYADLSASAVCPEGEDFLAKIKGEYQPLFEGATFNKEYDHYWHDYVAAVVGESAADETTAYMKASVGAKKYGENDNEAPNFFCGFTNDVTGITFGGDDGKKVIFTKKDGNSETRTYDFLKDAAASGQYNGEEMKMDGYLYEAQGTEDNDPFKYLLMFPDTPDTTYHLEFRYGATEKDVCKLLDGPYAYWVGSAIKSSALTEKNEDTLQKVISLFVVENLAEEMTTEETNAQRKGLVGTWDFLDNDMLKAYGFDSMYIELASDGTGKTYVKPAGADAASLISEYTFFAYDPDKTDGKDGGTYIAMNPGEETVTPGEYEIKTIDGKKALVFTSNEGEITYYYRVQKPGGNSGSGNQDDNVEPGAEHPSAAFEDLDTSAWYCEGTDYVIENGMMNGVGEKTFAPNDTTNRGMIVTILWRLEGEPKANSSAFADVEEGSWYEAAVNWAAEEGIVNGMNDTTFAPTAQITREQMATILARYAGYKDKDVSEKAELSAYTDAASVSDWAADAMGWAVASELIKGVTETTLQPQGKATRAQVAVLMQRLCEKILK